MTLMMENLHFANGKSPVADAFNGTVYSDIVSLRDHGRVLFVIFTGVGTIGTSTLTVEACDDVAASNVSAIAFYSRSITGLISAGDTEGAWARRTTAGYTTVAGSHRMEVVEADAKELGASGYGFARLKCVESAASAVLGGILIIAGGHPNRYSRSVNATVIV